MTIKRFLFGGEILPSGPPSLSELADRVLVAMHEYERELAKRAADMQDAAGKLSNKLNAIDPVAQALASPYHSPSDIEAELEAITREH